MAYVPACIRCGTSSDTCIFWHQLWHLPWQISCVICSWHLLWKVLCQSRRQPGLLHTEVCDKLSTGLVWAWGPAGHTEVWEIGIGKTGKLGIGSRSGGACCPELAWCRVEVWRGYAHSIPTRVHRAEHQCKMHGSSLPFGFDSRGKDVTQMSYFAAFLCFPGVCEFQLSPQLRSGAQSPWGHAQPAYCCSCTIAICTDGHQAALLEQGLALSKGFHQEQIQGQR